MDVNEHDRLTNITQIKVNEQLVVISKWTWHITLMNTNYKLK